MAIYTPMFSVAVFLFHKGSKFAGSVLFNYVIGKIDEYSFFILDINLLLRLICFCYLAECFLR